jgi:predicted  nucleic acid-binding Zn-ribbon protein
MSIIELAATVLASGSVSAFVTAVTQRRLNSARTAKIVAEADSIEKEADVKIVDVAIDVADSLRKDVASLREEHHKLRLSYSELSDEHSRCESRIGDLREQVETLAREVKRLTAIAGEAA